ncbi:unnamed protein product [Rotaria sp. Silwood1]|nr:unnamed protein product [Rotaria sp. Silwood1]
MIGVQDELRLSILLNLVSKINIALFIEYAHPIDKYTRFLYYSYLEREERLCDDISNIQNSIQSLLTKMDALLVLLGEQNLLLQFQQYIHILEAKGYFIYNVAEHYINHDDNEQSLEYKLIIDH